MKIPFLNLFRARDKPRDAVSGIRGDDVLLRLVRFRQVGESQERRAGVHGVRLRARHRGNHCQPAGGRV